ncbi:hypothetical protein NUW58_g363 [Xylaria curta]|uniref:Uncharacterized protein n=1 Tax=Xylaria curta TaxID=42375 RepID=A0ACC1PQP0_9PEZI|nr:hypothetical protein NUW58_g363 [Xylaria curta]
MGLKWKASGLRYALLALLVEMDGGTSTNETEAWFSAAAFAEIRRVSASGNFAFGQASPHGSGLGGVINGGNGAGEPQTPAHAAFVMLEVAKQTPYPAISPWANAGWCR